MIDQHERYQIVAAKVSFWGSVILFLISAIIGVAVDSITLILDASASLVILIVALLMHDSIRKIHRPPDEIFNFGYEKYEPFTVAVQNGLIIATCLVSVKFAIQDIIHADDITNYEIPTIAAFVSGIIGLFIALFLRRAGNRTDSGMLRTAGTHWFIDTGMSFGVCAGFFLGLKLKEAGDTTITPYVDPIMAILLATVFLIPPIKGLKRNIMELLDAVPSQEIQSKIRKVVDQYKPNSFGVHRLRARKAGEKIFVEICFIVKADLTVKEVEDLANNFERDLKGHISRLDAIVYFKPK